MDETKREGFSIIDTIVYRRRVLYRSNSDGTDRIVLAEIPAETILSDFIIYGDCLYYSEEIKHYDKNTGEQAEMNEARIASINLETGKRSEVSTTVYGYSAKCILLDVDENNCYFERIYSDEPFSMENATTRKYLCEIYCYDKKSKEEKEIILPQKQVRELCIWNQTAIYIAGDTEESRLYQMELNTGETTELTVPGFTAALSLYGDDLFFYTGKWGQSEHVQHHIDLNTMVDSKIPEKEDATQQLFVRNTYKSLFLISIGNTNEMGWCSRETYLLQTGEYYQIRESD